MAYASELAAPLLSVYARSLAGARPTPPHEWRTGVLVGADHIGDLLYRTASLKQLAEGLPQCNWHFIAPAPANEVLLHNPHLAGVHESLEAACEANQFDVAICYDTGSYWRWLLRCLKAGIPNRVAYVHKGFSAWVTHPLAINYPQPFPAYFRDLVAGLVGIPADWELAPQVYTTPEEEAEAQALHDELNPQGDARRMIVCFVTSRQPAGVWPAENFVRVAEIVQSQLSTRWLFCGAPGDSGLLEGLLKHTSLDYENICGRLSLRALVAFLRTCDAVFTTDSGPRHLSNAAKTPVFFVRNSSFLKVEAGSYSAFDHDLADLADEGHPNSGRSLDVQVVAKKFIEQLEAQ